MKYAVRLFQRQESVSRAKMALSLRARTIFDGNLLSFSPPAPIGLLTMEQIVQARSSLLMPTEGRVVPAKQYWVKLCQASLLLRSANGHGLARVWSVDIESVKMSAVRYATQSSGSYHLVFTSPPRVCLAKSPIVVYLSHAIAYIVISRYPSHSIHEIAQSPKRKALLRTLTVRNILRLAQIFVTCLVPLYYTPRVCDY